MKATAARDSEHIHETPASDSNSYNYSLYRAREDLLSAYSLRLILIISDFCESYAPPRSEHIREKTDETPAPDLATVYRGLLR